MDVPEHLGPSGSKVVMKRHICRQVIRLVMVLKMNSIFFPSFNVFDAGLYTTLA